MKALAITHKGLECISSLEIKELIKAKTETKDSVVLFEAKDLKDLYLLCYKGQSFIKVLQLFDSFSFKDDFFDILEKRIKKIDFKDFKDKSFVVRCLRIGEHKFSSQEVESLSGEYILDKVKAKVKLENPDVVFSIYIFENECYLGVDLAGFDLSKRDYKIYSTPTSIKGTIAYSLFKLVNAKGNILDPFCNSGEIAIEEALYFSGMSPHFYKKDSFKFSIDFDKLDKIKKPITKIFAYDEQIRNVKSSEKNAKIAGVNKFINFSKTSVDWLDTKFKKEEIDFIITYMPSPSRTKSEKDTEKMYLEFFHQAEFSLKEKIVCLTRTPDLLKKCALAKNFKVEKELQIWQGKQELSVLVFGK